MLKLSSVMIGTIQPKAVAAFYEQVLGRPADIFDPDNGFYGWRTGGSMLGVLGHSEMADRTKEPGRVIINFETAQVKEEFERLKALGAAVIKEPYTMGSNDAWLATLADPDGNYFQLMTPM